MRFAARRISSTLFPGVSHVDLVPFIESVALLSAGRRAARTRGRERLWPALCDSGAVVTVIPWTFTAELALVPSGMTRPLRAFHGHAGRFPWHHVLIGLPGLPLIEVRAIAPVDENPLRPRRHITLGRDVLSRLSIRCDSTLPWEIGVPLDADSNWTWEYGRSPQ